MTIREYLNLDSYDKSKETGEEMTHVAKYRRIVEDLGKKAVYSCVPFSVEQIKRVIKHDPHLNELSMKKLDAAAGFIFYTNDKTKAQDVRRFNSQLKNLLHNIGIDTFSPAELVCILKRAAVMMVEEA